MAAWVGVVLVVSATRFNQRILPESTFTSTNAKPQPVAVAPSPPETRTVPPVLETGGPYLICTLTPLVCVIVSSTFIRVPAEAFIGACIMGVVSAWAVGPVVPAGGTYAPLVLLRSPIDFLPLNHKRASDGLFSIINLEVFVSETRRMSRAQLSLVTFLARPL